MTSPTCCDHDCNQGDDCPLRPIPKEESFTRGWKPTLLLIIVGAVLVALGLSGCVKKASVLEAEARAKSVDCGLAAGGGRSA